MIRPTRLLAPLAALAVGLATLAAAQTAPRAHPAGSSTPLVGYLDADVPDSVLILPPPPVPGSAAQALDESVFLATRKLQGQPRWALATQDAVETPQAILDDYACALSVRLNAANAPALLHLLARVHRDAAAITTRAKDHYRRPRPFVGSNQPICAGGPMIAQSPSYPSGHTTVGWAFGLILAELAPDRASQVLARARAYGESRVVCGVHWVSDVEEGRSNGAALVAALHANPEFKADLDAAGRDLATARAAGAPSPSAAECVVPNEAAAHTPW